MKKLLLLLLAGYKRWLSPQLPAACRFTPSCSEYAAEAVARHGALRGALLAAWRLLRCHPLGGRGLDPVPELFGRRLALLSRALLCRLSPIMKSAREQEGLKQRDLKLGDRKLRDQKLGCNKPPNQATEAPPHAHAAHTR